VSAIDPMHPSWRGSLKLAAYLAMPVARSLDGSPGR